MAVATLTSKGQTTIPREIREGLDLVAGDELHFTLLPNGTVVMRAKKRAVASLAGMFRTRSPKRVSIQAMDEAIAQAAAERAFVRGKRTKRR